MNDRCLEAVSISRIVCAVRVSGFQARVLHAFPRALDLLVLNAAGLTDDATVAALVDPTVGDGPLNVVVSAPVPFAGVPAGAMVQGDGQCLRVDGLTIALDDAMVWEPRWPWERRAQSAERSAVSSQLPVVSSPRVVDRRPSAVRLPESTWSLGLGLVAQAAIADLRAALYTGDRRRLAEAAAALAGLGPGLTPAGDDFLAGVMWALRFFWPNACDVDALCNAIAAAAAPRTTPLSAALLRAAAAGLADARWHALFDALDRGEDATAALQAVLAQGATSGADAWAGFGLVVGE